MEVKAYGKPKGKIPPGIAKHRLQKQGTPNSNPISPVSTHQTPIAFGLGAGGSR